MALPTAFPDAPAGAFQGDPPEVEYADPGDDDSYAGPAVEVEGSEATTESPAEPVASETPAETTESPAADPVQQPEVAEAEPEPVVEPVVVFDADTLKQAKDYYGFDEETVRAFGTPENLRRATAILDRELLSFGRTLRGEQYQTQQEPATQARPSQEPPAPKSSTNAAAPAFEPFKLNLDPDSFDEPTLKQLNALAEHVNTVQGSVLQERARSEELQTRLDQFTSQQQQAEAAHIGQEMETFFAELGDEYVDIFGKGHWSELPPNSPALQSRVAFAQETLVMRDAEAARNRPRSQMRELQQRTLGALFPEKIKTTARKEVTAKIVERQSQAIARPSGRNKAPVTNPEEIAKSNIQKMLDKARIHHDDLSDEGL